MTLAFRAMQFARHAHATQTRKYINTPYAVHLAEVAGITASVCSAETEVDSETMIAVAWLHDTMEDQGITEDQLKAEFGEVVAYGVKMLSDLEKGNRAERAAMSRLRLSNAPGWVKTIKVADIISNTSTIVQFDPNFAAVYLVEKALLLRMIRKADPRLQSIADSLFREGVSSLGPKVATKIMAQLEFRGDVMRWADNDEPVEEGAA